MSGTDRQYECIVFGATGYTGKYTAEHIASHLPTDFKWAVAGRSEGKLKTLVNELKTINADRVQPAIEIAQLEKSDLVNLAKKTKVLITTVGPYHHYGTVVVEACAETGTHYVDATGEIPWVYDIVHKYHETAKKTGAIMITQDGIESALPDLLCFMLVSRIRETLNVGTGEVVHSIHEMNASASGGTLATALTIFDSFTSSDFARAQQPWSICPVSPPQQHFSKPLLERVTGVRTVDGLGTLTDSLQGPADTPIIHRTWGLYDDGKFYGPKFRFSAYMTARNAFVGFGVHLLMTVALTALIFSPIRALIKRFVYEPGQGPTKEEIKSEYTEWRAVATADSPDSNGPKRAFGRLRWESSLYHLTGVCLAESAIILAREKTLAHELGGGMLTPATLGMMYLERLEKAGLKVEVRMMD